MSRPEWIREAMFVAGRWVNPVESRVVQVENPATGQSIGTAAEAGACDVGPAVSAAAAAFPGWSGTSVDDRVDVLRRWLDILRERHELLVATMVAEVGAPRRIAVEAHVDTGLAVLEGYLDAAKEIMWEERVGRSVVLREAIGVAACITPWNYPLYQVLAKIGGALVAGSTVVLKPAELTPLSAYLLVDAAIDAELPGGVLNLLPGRGQVVGQALVTNPDVDVVSFTGSTAVGSLVSALAAATVKRVCLELGGKSASVVLDDAHLEDAVTGSIQAGMLNSGQTCSAWSRLVVPRQLLDRTLEIASAAADALVIGDPESEETWIGPLVSADQRATVLGYVDRAIAAGARLVAGGMSRPEALQRGHYVRPIVLSGVAESAEIVREEVFGPVVTVQPYDGQGDALRLANDSHYGLGGAVWSADPDRAVAFARGMRTGQVDVNGAAYNPIAPFGGYRRSGNGRELGRWGIEEFLETKSIQV